MDIPRELSEAAHFHTHLGPYLVVGLRMGAAVTRELGDEPFAVRITAHTGKVPPYSCAVDGMQLSTPCTVGNGCLVVGDERRMAIEAASAERAITITLRRAIFDRIENECTEENQERFACEIWEMPEGDLLEIVSSEPGGEND